jgi:hypothetical protein
MATGATSRLKIKGARSEDSGNYTCTMMGMKATTSVELNIQPGILVANSVLLYNYISISTQNDLGIRLHIKKKSSKELLTSSFVLIASL